MDEIRANPDEILHRIKKESNIESRGHLKIFFGYAAGVGKTYAMLKAAHAANAGDWISSSAMWSRTPARRRWLYWTA